MDILQKEFKLKPKARGFHLITSEIESNLPDLKNIQAGMAFIHIKHTSASLTINENADPDVRTDMESIFNNVIRENEKWYTHTLEGSDDMPAHAKSSILGCQLNIPITNGRLNLGTWQGIYLCEHRNRGGARKIVVTIIGS
ncbi:MAG: secondary thiamine-phosphate synthase enzyme YjbQ [Spirochaetales bacterium]|nr:secondary thiamine-phosphate synthase enzyme YjbQ [Spirochaetales bacterium]